MLVSRQHLQGHLLPSWSSLVSGGGLLYPLFSQESTESCHWTRMPGTELLAWLERDARVFVTGQRGLCQ